MKEEFKTTVVKHLKEQSHLAFRCVRSFDNLVVDVVCIARNQDGYIKTHLIQCEATGATLQSERGALLKAAAEFDCIPILASKNKISGSLNLDVVKEEEEKEDV